MLVELLLLATLSLVDASRVVAPVWRGNVVQDLHKEYSNIFKYGNRNAASHLWSTFLLDRSEHMTQDKLVEMFSGYCAVSGSPVTPHDYNRYRLTLPLVSPTDSGPTERTGFMHYCCWPCVCDTQDYIRVDTKNITTKEGTRQYHFAVLGNPCERPEELVRPFVQPFGRGRTTLKQTAAEVRCGPDGELIDATLSDHGYIIVNMFFDTEQLDEELSALVGADDGSFVPTPGRMTQSQSGVQYQDEREFGPRCEDRAANNYNSGMGEIFRKVAQISPIVIPTKTETRQEVPAGPAESELPTETPAGQQEVPADSAESASTVPAGSAESARSVDSNGDGQEVPTAEADRSNGDSNGDSNGESIDDNWEAQSSANGQDDGDHVNKDKDTDSDEQARDTPRVHSEL